MKTLLTIILTLCVQQVLIAQKQTITATVVNASSDIGKIGYALYDKENFMKKPLQAKMATIKDGNSEVVFENIAAGEYAIVCYHDKNKNSIMDFSKRGMPLEDFGASNNVMAFGPPQFSNAKFIVEDKDVSLKIKF